MDENWTEIRRKMDDNGTKMDENGTKMVRKTDQFEAKIEKIIEQYYKKKKLTFVVFFVHIFDKFFISALMYKTQICL